MYLGRNVMKLDYYPEHYCDGDGLGQLSLTESLDFLNYGVDFYGKAP